MLDLGVNGLDDGPSIALDLCISDCGSGSPPFSYKTGAKCTSMGKQKKQKYITRFPGISTSELCCPSYGATGSKNTDAVVLHQRITNALAAANPTIPRSRLACRVSQVVSVAIQRVVAYNALDFRYTKLKERAVGCGAQYEGLADNVCTGGADWDDDSDVLGGEDSGPGSPDVQFLPVDLGQCGTLELACEKNADGDAQIMMIDA